MGKFDAGNEFTEVGTNGAASDGLGSDGNSLPSSDSAAIDAATQKMNAIFGANDQKNQDDSLEEEGIVGPNDPDGDDSFGAKADAEKKDEVVEEEEGTVEEKAEADERKAVLDEFDANLKAVAKDLGKWSQQDIEDFIVASPALAKITFSRMQDGYNALSQQYARGQAAPVVAPQQNVATGVNTSTLDTLLADPKKLAELQEVAGKELTEGFIKPILAERARQIEDRAFIDGLRKESFVRDINDTFTAFGGQGFQDFYGKNGEVGEKQSQNRFAVGQLADQIMAGAKLQNVTMTTREALSRAHLVVTADQTATKARAAVRKEVTTRRNAITARPTARKVRVAPTDKSDAAAIESVSAFWSDRGQD